jgi:hypothetical protein
MVAQLTWSFSLFPNHNQAGLTCQITRYNGPNRATKPYTWPLG